MTVPASRLAREYQRPVLLFALEGGRATGSGRSIPGVALHDILQEIGHLFDELGGHEQAVGGSLPEGRLPELQEAARGLFARLVPDAALVRREEADLALALSEVDEDLLGWLERLEPHGMGNPRPVFHGAGVRPSGPLRPVGERGTRGRIESGGRTLDFVCWSGGLLEPLWASDRSLDVHYRLRPGWRGGAEAEIVAARPARA
jgi:single-stranded-DNA-specific exonuclease